MKNFIIKINYKWDNIKEPKRTILFFCFAILIICLLPTLTSNLIHLIGWWFIAFTILTIRMLGIYYNS